MYLILLVFIASLAPLQAQNVIQRVKLDNGKTIIIFDDKTWEYASDNLSTSDESEQDIEKGKPKEETKNTKKSTKSQNVRSKSSSSSSSSYSGTCGAPTKKGGSCRRKVRGGGRCWQHGG